MARSSRRCSCTGWRRARKRRAAGRSSNRSKKRSRVAKERAIGGPSLSEAALGTRSRDETGPSTTHPVPIGTSPHSPGAPSLCAQSRPREVSSRVMPAPAVIESFCERCGTRYTFEPPRQRGRSLTSIGKTLGILSENGTPESASLTASRDPFHGMFHFCLECRQYTCPNCWNAEAGFCQGCYPLPESPDMLAAESAASTEATTHLIVALEEVRVASAPDAWPGADLPQPEPAPLAALGRRRRRRCPACPRRERGGGVRGCRGERIRGSRGVCRRGPGGGRRGRCGCGPRRFARGRRARRTSGSTRSRSPS